MTYQLIIPKTVQKQLKKLPESINQRVIEVVIQLSENPRSSQSLKMANSQGYRIRVGDYRILYDIDDANKIITLRRIAHRRDVYR